MNSYRVRIYKSTMVEDCETGPMESTNKNHGIVYQGIFDSIEDAKRGLRAILDQCEAPKDSGYLEYQVLEKKDGDEADLNDLHQWRADQLVLFNATYRVEFEMIAHISAHILMKP